MDSSVFNDNQPQYDTIEPLTNGGSTCDTYRVNIYGKLHFLKRLKPAYADHIVYREALRKEFETGYRLEHPHLVRYISMDADGILMEYIDGETLTQRLAHHPDYFKSRRNTDKFLHQLLSALHYLHCHQVLHLDLKPDNILLTRIGNDVKLIDFGCAYTDTFADTQGHTDRFAAPEQRDGGQVDERTDIYALGKILQLLPCASKYAKIIRRCTEADKSKRFQTVGELQEAIRNRPFLRLLPLAALLLFLLIMAYSLWPSLNTSKESQTSSPARLEYQEPIASEELQVTAPSPIPASPKPSAVPAPKVEETSIEYPADSYDNIAEDTPESIRKEVISAVEYAEIIGSGIATPPVAQSEAPSLSSEEWEAFTTRWEHHHLPVLLFLDDTTNLRLYPDYQSYRSMFVSLYVASQDSVKQDSLTASFSESPNRQVTEFVRKSFQSILQQEADNMNQLWLIRHQQ